jgi:hypothetical protein
MKLALRGVAVLAGLVVVALLVLLVVAISMGEQQRHERRARVVAAALGARPGTSQSAIRRRLGAPGLIVNVSVRSGTERCWIYRIEDARASAPTGGSVGYDIAFPFCFVAGRLALPPEPTEPNEDVYFVKPGGLLGKNGRQPLTRLGLLHVSVSGRLNAAADENEVDDENDVYRVYVPPGQRLRVRVVPTADVDVEVWDARTASVYVTGSARRRHLIGGSGNRGTRTELVAFSLPPRAPRIVYVDVYLVEHGPTKASYDLTVSPIR